MSNRNTQFGAIHGGRVAVCSLSLSLSLSLCICVSLSEIMCLLLSPFLYVSVSEPEVWIELGGVGMRVRSESIRNLISRQHNYNIYIYIYM